MSQPTHLFVTYTCKRFEHTRARWQMETWPKRLPKEAKRILMTGGGNGETDNIGHLHLNCPDDYYNLVDKTQAMFDWFLEHRSEPYLIKVDDDVWLSDNALQKILNYSGLYGGLYLGNGHASGPLYTIHRSVLEKLPRLRDPSKPLKEWAPEDMAVGEACSKIQVYPEVLGVGHVEWVKDETPLWGPHTWDAAFAFNRSGHEMLFKYCEQQKVK